MIRQVLPMSSFEAQLATAENVSRVAGLFPENPFLSVEYVNAQRMLGTAPWLLSVGTGDAVQDGCFAFLRAGRLGRSLTIPSTPSAPKDSPFWSGFEQFLKEQKITDLECQTFGSYQVFIPPISGEESRVRREEFHLDLRAADLWSGLSNTHRRWVKKGGQNKLELRRIATDGALQSHMMLCDSSLERRRQRGETVFAGGTMYDEFSALLKSGAGELHQAIMQSVPEAAASSEASGDNTGETSRDGVTSSILLLRAPKGVYLVSAGTSEAGRAIGASHYLVYETARQLASEGITLFNLGGVRDEETGLRGYKAAFGSTPIPLVSLVATPGSQLRKRVITGVRKLAGVLLNRK